MGTGLLQSANLAGTIRAEDFIRRYSYIQDSSLFSLTVTAPYYFIYREFVTNEATTTWKTFYEEHNKTLESSGNDSIANPPRSSVGHLGKRIFDQQFQEVDANDLLTLGDGGRNGDDSVNNENLLRQIDVLESGNDLRIPAPQRKFELSSFTNNQSQMFADEFTVSGLGEVSDRISVNFTDVPLLGKKDDLEDIEKDLKRQADAGNMVYSGAFRAADVSEYIEVDLNMTHIGVRNDESDMSITDTIHSSEVNVSKIHTERKSSSAVDSKNWVINKENIAINPYVTPKESTNFTINEEPDKVLVFDGKRLTIQTELKEHVSRTSVTENISTISHRKPIVLNVDDDLPNFVDNAQASVSHMLCNDSHTKIETIASGGEMENIPMAESNDMLHIAERRRTILYESNAGDISVTQAIPQNIILPESVPCSSDKNKTAFENVDMAPVVLDVKRPSLSNVPFSQAFSSNMVGNPGKSENNEALDRMSNVPVTQAASSNVSLLQGHTSSEVKMKTVSGSEMENMSMTRVMPDNIILPDNIVSEKRKTIVFESDDDISITKAVFGNIILSEDQNVMHENRKTIVFNSEDADISMTEAVPIDNIPIVEMLETSGRRKTIVFESDHDISMTQAVSRNLILCENPGNQNTTVFDSNDADLSMTRPIPVYMSEISEKSKTIVFESDNDISMTQAIPTNIVIPEIPKLRKTMDFESDNDLSMTQAIPANIILLNVSENRTTDVYESDNISMPQAIPGNIILAKNQETVSKKSMTITFESVAADVSMTQAIPSIIIPENVERQDISMSIVPVILEESKNTEDNSKSEDKSVTQAITRNTIDHNQDIPKKSALNCNKTNMISLTTSIPTVDNLSELNCFSDISGTKSNTNVPNRQTIVEESDIDAKMNTQPLPTNLQLPEKITLPNNSGSITLSSPPKETDRKRQSQENTITELNHTGTEIEEPQVKIHAHSKITKMFRTEKMSNLTLTKPIPADLLTIQKILDKSNVDQLFNIVEEKEPTKQDFMVYQTCADKGVIPPINTDADSILKEPIPSATKDLSRTDLQHNKGQIELFGSETSMCPSLKDMVNSVSNSYYISTSPSNKSKTSNVTSESLPLAVVSNSVSQNTKSLAEDSNYQLQQQQPVSENSNSSSYEPKLLSETSSQQSKDGITRGSKKSLLMDLLDMSCASGLEDKSATAKIESDNSVNKETVPNTCENKQPEEEVVESIESLFYITSCSEEGKSEEDKEINPKEVPLHLPIHNNSTSDQNSSKNSMMRYLQQKMNKLKDKIPSNRFFERVVSPNKESYMTEQLLEMLDSFTDVEELTNPLDEINTVEDQNKFLSLATRNTTRLSTVHGFNQKGFNKNKSVSPRTNASQHDSPGSRASPPQVRPSSGQGSPVKRGFKKESLIPPHVGSSSVRGPASPRKSLNAGHGSTPRRHSATRQVPSPRVSKSKTIPKKDKKVVMEKECPIGKDDTLQENKCISKNKLTFGVIEKVSALDDYSSRENMTEDRKSYLINDLDPEKNDNYGVIHNELYVEDSKETIENVLCDQMHEIMDDNDMSKESVSNDLLYNSIKELNSPNNIDVSNEMEGEDDLASEQLNEINIIDKNDMSYVLKEAIMVKQLLYPKEDGNIRDENNVCTRDAQEKGLLFNENKNIEGTSTLHGLMPRQKVSLACSLESLVPKRRSSTNPRRQSVIISKEDLMSNISLAQAILQKELEETPIDEESPKSNNKEMKLRINNEVVKSLRFEDDEVEVGSESILGLSTLKSDTSSPLKKTVFGETSYMNDLKTCHKVNVIPTYLKDVTDGIKQLMNDLMKPDADADVLPFADTKIKKNKGLENAPSTRNSHAQADLFTSSQVDLQIEPTSTAVSRRSSTIIPQQGIEKICINKSVTVDFDTCPLEKVPEVIIFDPGNPLNNIYIKPADFADAHRYDPLHINDLPGGRSQNSSIDNSVEKMSTQYNARTIRSSCTGTKLNKKQKLTGENMSQVHVFDVSPRRITEADSFECPFSKMSDINTLQNIAEVASSFVPIYNPLSIDKAVDALEATNRDVEMNTIIAMRDNLKILQADSSLTLVNEAGDNEAKIDVSVHCYPLSPHGQISGAEIIYEQHNTDLGEVSNVQNLDQNDNTSNSKRKYSPCVVSSLDVTPKPATKIPKRSVSPDEIMNYDIKAETKRCTRSSHSSPTKYAQVGLSTKSTKDVQKSPNIKPNAPKDSSKSSTGRSKQARISCSPRENSKKLRSTTVNRLAIEGTVDKPINQQMYPTQDETMEYIHKQQVEYYVNEISTSSSKTEISHSASMSTSCGKSTEVTMEWLPELMNELSSKNLVTECESDINVLQMIDALPFMG